MNYTGDNFFKTLRKMNTAKLRGSRYMILFMISYNLLQRRFVASQTTMTHMLWLKEKESTISQTMERRFVQLSCIK